MKSPKHQYIWNSLFDLWQLGKYEQNQYEQKNRKPIETQKTTLENGRDMTGDGGL